MAESLAAILGSARLDRLLCPCPSRQPKYLTGINMERRSGGPAFRVQCMGVHGISPPLLHIFTDYTRLVRSVTLVEMAVTYRDLPLVAEDLSKSSVQTGGICFQGFTKEDDDCTQGVPTSPSCREYVVTCYFQSWMMRCLGITHYLDHQTNLFRRT